MVWCKFENLEVGKEIADMHYGLTGIKFDRPHRIVNHVMVPMSGGCNFIKQSTGKSPTNKMLMVIEMSINKTIKAAYSYDDWYFGLVEISFQ